MDIHERIKARRKEMNLSQADVAKKMGYLDRSTISRIESGKADITLPQLKGLAKVLDTTAAELFGLDEMYSESPKPMSAKDKLLNAIGLVVDEYIDNALSEEDMELLSLFHDMPANKKEELLRYAEFISKS